MNTWTLLPLLAPLLMKGLTLNAWSLAKPLLLLVLLAAGADNLLLLARLHPYEYVAYNHLVGGPRGAYERYEGDYWSDSLREASLMLNRIVRSDLGSAPAGLAVAVCAESVQASTFLDPRFRVVRDWPSASVSLLSSTAERDCSSRVSSSKRERQGSRMGGTTTAVTISP